jgi:hypothetical protein
MVGRFASSPGQATRALSFLALVTVAGCSAADVPGDDGALQGEVEVYIVEHDDGTSEDRYVLRVGASRIALEMGMEHPPALASGDEVEVRGVAVDDHFLVESVRLLETDDDVAAASAPLTGNAVERRSRVAALLVHWDRPNSLTVDTMRSRLFQAVDSTAQWNRENSYNLLHINGDAFGWFRIAAPSGCDYTTIATRARAAARDAGIDIDSYNQVMYYFPQTSACSWSGLASVGRPRSPARDSWYNGSSGCVVLAHELMHNFGARHSRSYRCSGSRAIAAPGNCSYSEYGDRFDVMGGGCFHTNNYQKASQGWFGGCNTVTVRGSGTFDLAPTQTASDGVQSLRIPMSSSLCPPEMSSCFYTVEYRHPAGSIEGGNSASAHQYRGVLVHVVPPADFTGSIRPTNPYLLDMHPATTSVADAALLAGESWQDPSGVSIHVEAAANGSARVRVELPGGGTGSSVCIDGSVFGGSAPPRDTTPPAITMVSPDDGAVRQARSAVDLVAHVTDAGGVAKVELLWTHGSNSWVVDCATAEGAFGCAQSGDTHTWRVQVGGEGTRTWSVRATDASGNVATSAVRTIEVSDPQADPDAPPLITHQSPAHGTTLRAHSTIPVRASVSSNAGVARSELVWWNDGTTTVIDCATASGAASCTRSGDNYTWSLQVGGGTTRYWRVRGTDVNGRQTTSGWSLIRLQ